MADEAVVRFGGTEITVPATGRDTKGFSMDIDAKWPKPGAFLPTFLLLNKAGGSSAYQVINLRIVAEK